MARRVTEPSFQFWFDDKYYTVQGAETMARLGTKDDLATMRAEYTRMRDTAQKRLKRLKEYNSGIKSVASVQHGFKKLKDIDSRDFPKAFSELAKFLKAKGSTVTGQKQIMDKTIKTWQDQGLNLNRKNYYKTMQILEEMRRRKIVYGSDKAVELADSMLELDDRETNEWLDYLDTLLLHSDEIDELKGVIQKGAYMSMDELIEMIGW